TFDAQGRLLIGTEGGIWRAVNNSYSYDFTSGGRGIRAFGGGGGGGFNPPAATVTSINGNLQIPYLTNVGIDPLAPRVWYTTQASTGTAGSTAPLQWVSQGLTGPTTAGGTNLDIPTAAVVVVGAPDFQGQPSKLYRVWQFANSNALFTEVSTDGGITFQ